MTKKDLKSGHIVTLRNGRVLLVLRDCASATNIVGCHDILTQIDGKENLWCNLSDYNEDLLYKPRIGFSYQGSFDIVKIQRSLAYSIEPIDSDEPLWVREDTIELIINGKSVKLSDETLANIKKALK